MGRFLTSWHTALEGLKPASLREGEREELERLKQEIQQQLDTLQQYADSQGMIDRWAPFVSTIIELAEARQRVDELDARMTAGRLDEMARQIGQAHTNLREELASNQVAGFLQINDLKRAHTCVTRMRSVLENWFSFYNGYDPTFTWWMRDPYKEADGALAKYEAFLKEKSAELSGKAAAPESQTTALDINTPRLRALIERPQQQMVAVIDRFQTERRQLRRDRRSRNRSPSPEQRARAAKFYSAWRKGLEQLDFDSMKQEDRADFVLLKNHLGYQQQRLKLESAGQLPPSPLPPDNNDIVGYPIGREALLVELQHEMIPYTPAELIAIAEQEYAWCRKELLKASREMGFGSDWRQAVEKVKGMHVEPGKQPQLIRDLAQEAIDYLEKHRLVTVPPLARETWRMQMMSPKRQLVSPFFLGGEVIRVSFPTDTMSHESKLQSMRGNNIPFARATVHHELIPGHHLQGFMTARHRPHRRLFATPFWGEGWALYWEMVLYDRGFPKTPEDRVGFLVWRSHRCARIIFSLSFHLGRMTPQQCIDLLVARVGFERNNATAEVRRSVGRGYSPLYQAAYMLGGLQIRELRRELVDSGRMTELDFHDAILKQNRIPIELLLAILAEQPITRDFKSSWRFYGESVTESQTR